MDNVLYIVNPAAQGGSGAKTWESFRAIWPAPINPDQIIITEKPGHAREIAAARNGCDIIAAVGGDGTAREVISGIMDRQGMKPRVALIPCGTGNDIGREIGIFSVKDAVAALQVGHARSFDLVRIDSSHDGVQRHGYGFLFGCVGFSANSMMRPWMKRLLGPKGAYFLTTFLQIFVYRAPHMTIRTGNRKFDERIYMVIAGNAEWVSGGSMRMSPGAITDDGQLNITVVPSLSRLKIITRLFPRIASGAHIREPGVSYFTEKTVEVHSNPPVIVEVDGDLFGKTPASLSICPGAVQIICFQSLVE